MKNKTETLRLLLLLFLRIILFVCIIGLEVGSIEIYMTIDSLADIGAYCNSDFIELLPKIAIYIYAISTALMIFLISDLFKKIKNKWLVCFLIIYARCGVLGLILVYLLNG